MIEKFEKLKALLKELFQLDQPDLDFGLYRIMHAKKPEILRFLDNDLFPQVKEAFKEYQSVDKSLLERRLSKMEQNLREASIDPDDSPVVRDIHAHIENISPDIEHLVNSVYDHLYHFFRRYYSEGDFIAKRVYKSGVYAIPYEGEEISLHWANKDQYYVKSSEYFRNYSFRLQPDDDDDPMRVHFKLSDATESDHNNNKPINGRERVFILASSKESEEDYIFQEDGIQGKELIIRFEYRPSTLSDWPESERTGKKKSPTQQDHIQLASKRILSITNTDLSEWIAALTAPHHLSNGNSAEYSKLEAHIRRYTARNTYDFFIHKDLEIFLKRELDFYIKNEVIHLDDVQNATIFHVQHFLSTVKVIRTIANKIIDFLAQLENFQKKLWLKKKFVVDTSYCITIGTIPEEFYPEIIANKPQSQEWIDLYAIDKINGDLVTPRYTKKMSMEFLNAHPTLMIDTKHFNANFTHRLLDTIENLDDHIDGTLFHSENFQALSLMSTHNHERFKCVYIDPPFNTSEASLLYKNEYRHSTWMTLIQQGILRTKEMLHKESVLSVAIDDFENDNLSKLLNSIFGSSGSLGTLIVETKPSGRTNDRFLATCHEYYHFYGLSGTNAEIRFFPLSNNARSSYTEVDQISAFKWRDFLRTGGYSSPEERPNSFYPIYFIPASEQIHLNSIPGAIKILPIDSNGKQRVWRKTPPSFLKHVSKGEIKIEQRNSGEWKVFLKDRIKDGTRPKSVWVDRRYDAASHGSKLLTKLFGRSEFGFPKALGATKDVLYVTLGDNLHGEVLDYFAGSGTTGHAIICLNREDGNRRKFTLVEMGYYFDTVLIPRLKKVTFTPDWKNGQPARQATPTEIERSPRMIKILRLESYEDTLNNLEFHTTHPQKNFLNHPETEGVNGFREQYILRYMLDSETRGSRSLLNVQAFNSPESYKLSVKLPGSDENREVPIDLIETFNWLIGLTVKTIAAPQSFSTKFQRDNEQRLQLNGNLRSDMNGAYWFRALTGSTPDGQRALIIWRKLNGDLEKDNLVLNTWFLKHYYSSQKSEFDIIWVNGGTNLEKLKNSSNQWDVRLIEDDFHSQMFNGEDVL